MEQAKTIEQTFPPMVKGYQCKLNIIEAHRILIWQNKALRIGL